MASLQYFFDNAKELFVVVDCKFKLVAFNSSFENAFYDSFNKKCNVGMNIVEELKEFPEDQQQFCKLVERTLNGETFTTFENIGKNYYEIKFHPLENENCIIGGSAIFSEIIEGDRNSKVVNSIINNSTNLIAILDLNYRFITFNSSFRSNFEKLYGKKIVIGTNLKEVLDQDLQEKLLGLWKRALSGEEFTVVDQFGISNKDYYEIRFSPLYDDKGKLIGASQSASNITQRIQMENSMKLELQQLRQELEQRNKQISESNKTLSKLQKKLELIKGIDIALWVYDIKSDYITGEEKFKEIYQLQISHVKKEEIFKKIHPEDVDRIKMEMDAAITHNVRIDSILEF